MSTAYSCRTCDGSGHSRVRVATTSLSSAGPTYEERNCGDCAGTGQGVRASTAELEAYYSEEIPLHVDLFTLAKAAAAHTSMPKERLSHSSEVATSTGFFSSKTKIEVITREVETDYWVLTTKKGRMTRTSPVGHGESMEEERNEETIFCLVGDGSLRKMSRSQTNVRWKGHYEKMPWSAWEAVPLMDLDHFIVDFDFTGTAEVELPEWHRTEVVGDMAYYTEREHRLYLRQIYPKGIGLVEALSKLTSSE